MEAETPSSPGPDDDVMADEGSGVVSRRRVLIWFGVGVVGVTGLGVLATRLIRTQLQESLTSLGYNPGGTEGTFGPGTKRALKNLYSQLGYEVATAGDNAAVTAAQQRVTSAQRALDQAQQALTLLQQNPPPTSEPGQPDPVAQAQQQVDFAQEDLETAIADRDEIERTSGPMLLLSEYVFLPDFPGRVEQSAARVGVEVTAPLLTLSSGTLVVRARLNPGQRALIAEGMTVQILSELQNMTAAGVVASVGELEQDDRGGRTHPMVVTPTDAPLDERLAGADVRLTVQAAATEGEVLAVPLTAVYNGADGNTAVLKLLPNGIQQRVLVTAGVSGDGYVAITPVDGELQAGELVIVGAGGAP